MSSTDDEQLPPVDDEQLQQMFANAGTVIRTEEEMERKIAALLEATMDEARGRDLQNFLASPQMTRARLAASKLPGEGPQA